MLIYPVSNYGINIRYEKSAEKFFAKHEDIRAQYIDSLSEWLDNPERVDVKTIRGKRGKYYRMRIGGWRVIFSVVNGNVIVINTILAGSRGDIYKKIGGIK
ncbi:MAG: type II toxin-antitoxin system RelE/ParE family toxin [Synergistaceae bacterium]|nr:type II toxin-antitoxin system RelE/ParE family toxin [Synergistaceae bacterium]